MDFASLYKKLESFVMQLVEKLVNKKMRDSYLVSRKAVIINHYDSESNSASIIIPTDKTSPTNYYYPNRSGINLVAGQKAYLVYQTGNISQGWIEINTPLNDLTFKNLTVNNNVIIQGNLTVDNNTNLNNLNVVNETVSGTINKKDGNNLYPYLYFTEEENW